MAAEIRGEMNAEQDLMLSIDVFKSGLLESLQTNLHPQKSPMILADMAALACLFALAKIN